MSGYEATITRIGAHYWHVRVTGPARPPFVWYSYTKGGARRSATRAIRRMQREDQWAREAETITGEATA